MMTVTIAVALVAVPVAVVASMEAYTLVGTLSDMEKEQAHALKIPGLMYHVSECATAAAYSQSPRKFYQVVAVPTINTRRQEASCKKSSTTLKRACVSSRTLVLREQRKVMNS